MGSLKITDCKMIGIRYCRLRCSLSDQYDGNKMLSYRRETALQCVL